MCIKTILKRIFSCEKEPAPAPITEKVEQPERRLEENQELRAAMSNLATKYVQYAKESGQDQLKKTLARQEWEIACIEALNLTKNLSEVGRLMVWMPSSGKAFNKMIQKIEYLEKA